MQKKWKLAAITLGITLALAGCSNTDAGDASTSGLLAGVVSDTQTECAVGTTSALGTYMGTIAEYQSTFDTLFDADGYRVVAIGENSDAGIVNAKYGVIDTEGNFVVQPIYDEIVWEFYTEEGNAGEDVLPSVFYNGYLQVVKDGKMGLVDETGTEVIPCEYTTVCMPSEGICTLYNRIEGMYSYESYCSYVGYWSLEKGCEILSPDTYYCMVENAPIGDNLEGTGYAYKPEGDAYCAGDFIGGYAMVVTDPSYVISANTTLSDAANMNYVNLIDTDGNFLYGQSYLTIWMISSGFTTYPQHADYLAIYQLLDYSAHTVVTANGTTVSLSPSRVYGAGVVCASGTVLAAEYTSSAHTDGASYFINTVYPTIDLANNCITIGYNLAPGTICENGTAYYTLNGQPSTAPTLEIEAAAEYTIVIQDERNGIQAADGTITVPYQYTYLKQGVSGSTWYVCRDESGMCGMVDITTGEEILPCMYDRVGFSITDGQENINHFELGVCYVSLGDKEYLVNADNEIVVDISGLNVSEAYNGLYPCSSLGGYMDNQGRIVLPSYTATRGLDDPYSTYTLYQKDGFVYQISANYLVDSSKVYGETTAVYIPDVTATYCAIDTAQAKTTYVAGDAFTTTGVTVLYGMLHSGGYADVAATASYTMAPSALDGLFVAPNWDEGLGAWVYLQWADDVSADCTYLQFIPAG